MLWAWTKSAFIHELSLRGRKIRVKRKREKRKKKKKNVTKWLACVNIVDLTVVELPQTPSAGISAFLSAVRLTGDTCHAAYRRSPVSKRTCKPGFPVVARAIIVPQCPSLRRGRRICQEKANVNARGRERKVRERGRNFHPVFDIWMQCSAN